MSLHCKVFTLTLATVLLFASCSRKNPRTVTTRDGRTIKFKKLALVESGWFNDRESGNFALDTSAGTVNVPRDFKGIKSFEVLQIGLTGLELREKAQKNSDEEASLRIDEFRGYPESVLSKEQMAKRQEAQQKRQKLEEEIRGLKTTYRFRIVYDSGNVLEGQSQQVELPGWGYLKGRTDIPGGLEGDMKIPMNQVLTVTRE
jgi:hypothetical protein